MKESNKEIYNFYKSHKLCPWCRKNKSYKNYIKCLTCLIEDRNYQKKKNVQKEWKTFSDHKENYTNKNARIDLNNKLIKLYYKN